MDINYKNISTEELTNAVINSDSFTDVLKFMNFKVNSTTRRNIERLVKKRGISVQHFSTVQRVVDYKKRYDKDKILQVIPVCQTFKDILIHLDLLPITSNYNTLKKYLDLWGVDYNRLTKRLKYKYTKENLTKIVSTSATYNEVLSKLDLQTGNSMYYTVLKHCKSYGIDTSHLSSATRNVTKKLSDILVVGASYNRTDLKRRLYADGLKQPICELCGQDEWWHGKRMSLILDHINGINNDNRLENLRIVCPNCEGTLETHCRGHKHIDK